MPCSLTRFKYSNNQDNRCAWPVGTWIRLSRHSIRECGVKLETINVLLEIHVTFAERTTTMVPNSGIRQDLSKAISEIEIFRDST